MSYDAPDIQTLIRDFSPGFLDTPEEDTLPDGATPDAKNSWLTNIDPTGQVRRATLTRTPGTLLLNPTAIAAGKKVDGLFEFRQTAITPELLAICNGKGWIYDGIDTFVQIGATAPWTAGEQPGMTLHRDNAYLYDGTAQRRYDGTTLFTVGQIAPTSVTNMTAVAPAGAGVTGTYESLYTWYDATLDHESSPSAVTTPVAFVAQDRRHTKPGGAPAAQYTHWRAYVRRTDTSEIKFTRTATTVVGTANVNEAIPDDVRADLAPGPSDNDPPPGAWIALAEYKGLFFGVLPDSSDLYVSNFNQPQSWQPRNVFPVAIGDGQGLSGLKPFGSDLLVQKPHRTWRLVGDALPFVIEPLHSSLGGVGVSSGLEVNGFFYDWDREKGPYRTDLVSWVPLADGRIADVIATVTPAALADVRCLHVEHQAVIGWQIPTNGASRKQTILWYNYVLDTWLPPRTGLEWASWTQAQLATGATQAYVGDEWGRVYQLFSGKREGVPTAPANTTKGVVTAATASTVTAGAMTFYTTGSGLAGLPVAVRSPAGVWQWRRIESNTATVLTLDTTNNSPFSTVPLAGYDICVGGIEWFQWTKVFDVDHPEIAKTFQYLFIQGRADSEAYLLDVFARFNDDAAIAQTFAFAPGGSSGVWGSMIWGVGLWGTAKRGMTKQRIDRTKFTMQLGLSNYWPDQGITITLLGFSADGVKKRKVPSA